MLVLFLVCYIVLNIDVVNIHFDVVCVVVVVVIVVDVVAIVLLGLSGTPPWLIRRANGRQSSSTRSCWSSALVSPHC